MSRLGKLPLKQKEGVQIETSGQSVTVTGPKGSLKLVLPKGLGLKPEGTGFILENKLETKQARANFGTNRQLLEGMVEGVSTGWKKTLELIGTGYRANVDGGNLVLTVGYSHPVIIKAPEGITFLVEKSIITVEGIDKSLVGQISANVRAVRPPEPYKGKGIKYTDEFVRRKAGKAAKTAAA